MNGELVLDNFEDRLEAFRQSDAERDALVTELIRSYQDIKLKYEEKDDDYKNEVASRRIWQSKASLNERALNEQRQATGSNNFVIAIIDGDGAIFQDTLYAMGKDGGAEAAHLLHTEIERHLKITYPESNVSDWSIVVQVFLNLQGLGTKLAFCNILVSQHELSVFGHAFGLARPLFSFIDVGNGKEHADHKIRETLRLYVPNAQCKHILFAPCHDNGYLPVLEPYKRDRSITSRLTLIETRPAEPGFIELGLKRIHLPHIFRSNDLPSRPLMAVTSSTNSMLRTKTPPNGHIDGTARANSTSASESSVSTEPSKSSWATVGKAGATSKTINIGAKKTPNRRSILLNAYDQRLDSDLPKKDPMAENILHDRMRKHGNFCNDFHINARCDLRDNCPYHHGERLAGSELLVLKLKARTRRCPSKNDCRNVYCTHGHHCKLGKGCYFNDCFFSNTHIMDLEPAKRMYEDGDEEWLQSYLDKHRG